VREPVIIHWLGEMFDPALAGYWGNADHMRAMDAVPWRPSTRNAAKVDGVKVSLLDKDKEIAMRRRLRRRRAHVHRRRLQLSPELIAGDGGAATEPAVQRCAARHLRCDRAGGQRRRCAALGRRRPRRFNEILAPTVPLSRHALQGADALLQDRRRLHGLPERSTGPLHHGRRPAEHPLDPAPGRTVPPGRRAGLLRDPDLACARMRTVLALHGIV
jgi:hypothetical protein